MVVDAARDGVPEGFVEEVRTASDRGEVGRLGLLGVEAAEYRWKAEGLWLVEAGLRRVGGMGAGWVASGLGLRSGAVRDEGVRAVVFTGHRMDTPGRRPERLPARAEGAARAAIRSVVMRLIDEAPDVRHTTRFGDTEGTLVGIAGGASGGDLLFHEICGELGVKTVLRLTLPAEAFVAESVAAAGEGWVRRFEALLARLGEDGVEVLGGVELPEWMGERADYDVWQRTNLWLVQEAIALASRRTLVALWDGERGDGPGGTQHLVEAAERFGLEVAPPIMTDTLLGGG